MATEYFRFLDKAATGTGDGLSWLNAYTDWDEFNLGEAKALDTSDEICHLYVRGTLDKYNFPVWTTDSTRYLIIEADPFFRHEGLYGAAYPTITSTAADFTIRADCDLKVIGFQMLNTGGGYCIVAEKATAGTLLGVEKNLFLPGSSDYMVLSSKPNDLYVSDNICIAGTGAAAIYTNNAALNLFAYKNTFANFGYGIRNQTFGSMKLKSNIFENSGTRDLYNAVIANDANFDYNHTTRTDETFLGTNGTFGQTFTFVNAVADDYRLDVADVGALGKGLQLEDDADYEILFDIGNTYLSGDLVIDAGAFQAITATGTTYTVSKTNLNGSIDLTPELAQYNSNAKVSALAVGDTGYNFTEWAEDLTGSTNPQVITMDSNKSLTATFAATQYTITVNIDGGGYSLNPSQPTYEITDNVIVTAIPDEGSSFYDWQGDLTGTINPDTLTVTGNMEVTARLTNVPGGTLIDQDNDIPFLDDKVFIESQAAYYPDINDIINAPAPRISVYGLFSWYTKFYDGSEWIKPVNDVGLTSMRIGANNADFLGTGLDGDPRFSIYLENGWDVLWTIIGKGPENVRGNEAKYGLVDTDPGDQAFIDEFTNDFIQPLLERYGPNGTYFDDYPEKPYLPIKYLELFNEPNLYYLFGEGYVATMDQKSRMYAKLLYQSYQFIKYNATYPEWASIEVLGLAASGISRNDVWNALTPDNKGFIELVHEYIEIYYGVGTSADSYDILSDHPYTHAAPPEAENYPMGDVSYNYSMASSFKTYTDIVKTRWGIDKPVWFTEVGWPRENGAYPEPTYWNVVPERYQAAYTLRTYLACLRLGVETAHIMYMFDSVGNNWAWFNNDDASVWYEVAHVIQKAIELMPMPRITGVVSDNIDGYCCYKIKPDYNGIEDDIYLAWNTGGIAYKEILVEQNEYDVTDMFGNVVRVLGEQTTIKMELGPFPVYISLQSAEIPEIPEIPVVPEIPVIPVDTEGQKTFNAVTLVNYQGNPISPDGTVISNERATVYKSVSIISGGLHKTTTLVNKNGYPIDKTGNIVSNNKASVYSAVCLVNSEGKPVNIDNVEQSGDNANIFEGVLMVDYSGDPI